MTDTAGIETYPDSPKETMTDLTMTPAEHREHALRIASDLLTNAEFCEVYEDDELESATEDDLQAIHTLILNSTPALPEVTGHA